jgi:hypothetical protein
VVLEVLGLTQQLVAQPVLLVETEKCQLLLVLLSLMQLEVGVVAILVVLAVAELAVMVETT